MSGASGEVLECSGDPRAMGTAQGRACRVALRRSLPEGRRRFPLSLRRLASGPVLGTRAGLGVIRHYTHLSERMHGLARGAGLSFDSVMACALDAEGAVRGEERPRLSAVEAVARAGARPFLARSLDPGAPWLVRRSRPAVGHASAELTLPWLAHGIAGVNEHGLAALLLDPGPGSTPEPPGALLVQECLQRFGDLLGGLDWCSKRPCAPGAGLLLADADGQLAYVETGPAVRISRPGDGLWVHAADAARAAELRKGLADGGEGAAGPRGDVLELDPARRGLRLVATGRRVELTL